MTTSKQRIHEVGRLVLETSTTGGVYRLGVKTSPTATNFYGIDLPSLIDLGQAAQKRWLEDEMPAFTEALAEVEDRLSEYGWEDLGLVGPGDLTFRAYEVPGIGVRVPLEPNRDWRDQMEEADAIITAWAVSVGLENAAEEGDA